MDVFLKKLSSVFISFIVYFESFQTPNSINLTVFNNTDGYESPNLSSLSDVKILGKCAPDYYDQEKNYLHVCLASELLDWDMHSRLLYSHHIDLFYFIYTQESVNFTSGDIFVQKFVKFNSRYELCFVHAENGLTLVLDLEKYTSMKE